MPDRQAVTNEFKYGLEEDEPFYDLSDKLRVVIEESGFGEYDGHEMPMDNSDGSFYLYRSGGKKSEYTVKETIEKTSFMAGANIRLRFGTLEDGVKEVSFILNLS